ncbi:hypothetical protein BJX63DRAFT_432255 [Aspergillus granulosus]|uniref:Leucine-rich repeat domain-containing protein n=1 Tax=Aspergillus granulosus TaxID=176169 RepID=A0ABR4HC16_9EURO
MLDYKGLDGIKERKFQDCAIDELAESKLLDLCDRIPMEPDRKSLWTGALRGRPRNWDAIIACLLILMPSLTELEIPITLSCEHVSYLLTTHAGGANGCVLPNLTALTIECRPDNGYPIDFLLPLLSIPSLSHFFGTSWVRPLLPLKTPKSSSNITHLNLQKCLFEDGNLGRILTYCPSLQSLEFSRVWNPWRSSGLRSSSINADLRPIRGTLRTLSLLHDECSFLDEVEKEINPLNFADFPVLTSLYTSTEYLVRDPWRRNIHTEYDREAAVTNAQLPLHKRLPSSLEVLWLSQPKRRPTMVRCVLRELRRLLTYKAQFLRLRELGFEAWFVDDDEESMYDARTLRSETDQAEIELSLLNLGEEGLENKEGKTAGVGEEDELVESSHPDLTYASKILTFHELHGTLESALEFSFELHESGYFGEYYLAEPNRDESIRLFDNTERFDEGEQVHHLNPAILSLVEVEIFPESIERQTYYKEKLGSIPDLFQLDYRNRGGSIEHRIQ